MSTETAGRNPFDQDIVNEPREIEQAVAGLNDAPLRTILDTFSRLEEGALPRRNRRLPHGLLVTSPQAGYGKSHLIGRLFKELNGRATLVNVRPFQAPDSCWKSLLGHTLQELNQADRFSDTAGENGSSQLTVFAHGVLTHLLVHIERAKRNTLNARYRKILDELQQSPLEAHRYIVGKPAWKEAVQSQLHNRSIFSRLVEVLEQGLAPLALHASSRSWLKVLIAFGFPPEESLLLQTCRDWLKGDPVDAEEARLIGIAPADQPPFERSESSLNEISRQRLHDLCLLSAYFRPLLFCFDQTETYGQQEGLARSLGQVVGGLVDFHANQLVLLTANSDPWQRQLEPHWEVADRHRLSMPPLQLEGLSRSQGEALAQQRLSAAGISGEVGAKVFPAEWFAELFAKNPQPGVRTFLQACRNRWLEGTRQASPPSDDLKERFNAIRQRVRRDARHLGYDADILVWALRQTTGAVAELLAVTGGTGYETAWQTAGLRLTLVPDDGNHWKHWQSVAKRATERHRKEGACWEIRLRSPDLLPVPGKNWHAAAEVVRQAEGRGLVVAVLTPVEMGLIHAAWEIHAECAEGDLAVDAATVARFIAAELSPIWQRILSRIVSAPAPQPSPEENTPSPGEGIPEPPPTPSPFTGKEPSDTLAAGIRSCYARFRLEVIVGERVEAPQLVSYRLEPGPGVTIASLINREVDLQVHLRLVTRPVLRPEAGAARLELPKEKVDPVNWSQWKESMAARKGSLVFPVGVGVDNRLIVADLEDVNQCHLLVAGTTGSGKSVFLQSLVAALMGRNRPESLRMTIVDAKYLSFTRLKGSHFLAQPVIGETTEAMALLEKAVEEMNRRYRRLEAAGYESLAEWRARSADAPPYWVFLFDEFADMVLGDAKEKKAFEKLVSRLAGKARAAGIHLVLATQRPDARVVTGLIKANLPLRVCFKVGDATNSRIVLDQIGAEALLGRGDLLCNHSSGLLRAQGLYITPEELEQQSGLQLGEKRG
ncbi:MAG: hypothetical protein HQL56_12260 [Magnetococcales bacterium]|nr:hypothetical protein [Magnetococcales bacterium]